MGYRKERLRERRKEHLTELEIVGVVKEKRGVLKSSLIAEWELQWLSGPHFLQWVSNWASLTVCRKEYPRIEGTRRRFASFVAQRRPPSAAKTKEPRDKSRCPLCASVVNVVDLSFLHWQKRREQSLAWWR